MDSQRRRDAGATSQWADMMRWHAAEPAVDRSERAPKKTNRNLVCWPPTKAGGLWVKDWVISSVDGDMGFEHGKLGQVEVNAGVPRVGLGRDKPNKG
jgi:hypothetical protein